jgi:small subunit ribosomal protein S17
MPKRVITGKVVSDKMQKTVVVAVESTVPHHRYKKLVKHTKKFKAHDEDNTAREGDIVRIEESRPLSKDKAWRLLEVVERANQ